MGKNDLFSIEIEIEVTVLCNWCDDHVEMFTATGFYSNGKLEIWGDNDRLKIKVKQHRP